MIDPNQLLDVAAELARAPSRGAPRQAKLRRAISTAYYALFHCMVGAASDLLAGQNARGTKRHTSVYRAFEHKRMADVCKQVSQGTLRNESGVPFHTNIQECAAAFAELQESRHGADYDPTLRLPLSDAKAAVSKARDAVEKLQAAPNDERFYFLTLLQFKPR